MTQSLAVLTLSDIQSLQFFIAHTLSASCSHPSNFWVDKNQAYRHYDHHQYRSARIWSDHQRIPNSSHQKGPYRVEYCLITKYFSYTLCHFILVFQSNPLKPHKLFFCHSAFLKLLRSSPGSLSTQASLSRKTFSHILSHETLA